MDGGAEPWVGGQFFAEDAIMRTEIDGERKIPKDGLKPVIEIFGHMAQQEIMIFELCGDACAAAS